MENKTITISKDYTKSNALSFLFYKFNREDTSKENVELFKKLRSFIWIDFLLVDDFINLSSLNHSYEQYSERS